MYCTYKRNNETRSLNRFRRGKGISITYFECVYVALVIQHTKRIHHIVIVACPAQQYFSTSSHKRHDFRRKKIIEHKMYVLISLQSLFETSLILRRTERDMIENVYWCLFKVPIIIVLICV
jgi:hypothetical protein